MRTRAKSAGSFFILATIPRRGVSSWEYLDRVSVRVQG